MKQNTLKKVQKDLKDIPGSKKKKPNSTGHGGARSGSGRDAKEYKSKIAGFNLPIRLLEGIAEAKIDNNSAYISYLVAKDLIQKVTDENAKKEFKEMAAAMKKGIYKTAN